MEQYALAGLASGFSTSLLEIVVFFLIVLVALVLWIGVSLHRARLEKRNRDSQAEAYYRQLLESRGLSESEKELVHSMAEYIRNPRERYLILQDQRMFNQVATTILENDSSLSRASISALRMSLGFTGAPTGQGPHATAELPSGAIVQLQRGSHEAVRATVHRHEKSSFRVKLDPGDHRFLAGQPVRISFRNEAGIFYFHSTVFGQTGEELELSHSEGGSRLQRRQHFRRTFLLPVTVSPRHDPEGSIKSEFRELGGNGATVLNPERRFTAEEEVELTFDPEGNGENTISLMGTIARTSEEDSLLHIRFFYMPESERDRIYRLLFNP
ncbi:MAG: PilZ domain-containing protein [Spirochaetaceae bacterium]|nr:MAG: PilZ domain-containing protein [Spirochaetaceae bacterium]